MGRDTNVARPGRVERDRRHLATRPLSLPVCERVCYCLERDRESWPTAIAPAGSPSVRVVVVLAEGVPELSVGRSV